MKNEPNNPFFEGQKVVCISDDFPLMRRWSGGADAIDCAVKPKIGDVLIIAETLGLFLRFDEFDTELSYNWFHWNRFAPFEDDELESVSISVLNPAITFSIQ